MTLISLKELVEDFVVPGHYAAQEVIAVGEAHVVVVSSEQGENNLAPERAFRGLKNPEQFIPFERVGNDQKADTCAQVMFSQTGHTARPMDDGQLDTVAVGFQGRLEQSRGPEYLMHQ